MTLSSCRRESEEMNSSDMPSEKYFVSRIAGGIDQRQHRDRFFGNGALFVAVDAAVK